VLRPEVIRRGIQCYVGLTGEVEEVEERGRRNEVSTCGSR